MAGGKPTQLEGRDAIDAVPQRISAALAVMTSKLLKSRSPLR